MVFCNIIGGQFYYNACGVTILILIDGFLQYNAELKIDKYGNVTILILIDGFLQYHTVDSLVKPCTQSQSLF